MRTLILSFSLLFGFSIFSSCTRDKTPAPLIEVNGSNCDPNHVYFQNDVLPILSSNCAKSGCHDAATHQSGYNYSTYASAYATIHPGNANTSKLYKVITNNGDDLMPPSGNTPLTNAQINIIAQWIEQGGLNDFCSQDSSGCVTQNMSYASDIAPILSSNCNGCHSGGSPSGGINLTSYSGVSAVASSGKLFNSVAQNGQSQPMPPTTKLSSCNISKIKSWVDAGYPNN